PPYLSQQQGAFEVEPCVDGHSGQCVQQQAAVEPIEWDNNAAPYTIGGNLSWSNYTVSADALMEQAGAGQLLGRVGTMQPVRPAALNDHTISAAINGTTVGTVTDSAYASGMIGIGTSGYQTDQFSDLSTTLIGSTTPTGEVIAGDDPAECMDANAGSSTPGTKVQMWDCNDSGTSHQWTRGGKGTIGI